MRVIECRASHPHGDFAGAAVELGRIQQAAQSADDDGPLLVVHRVTGEVGRGIQLSQLRLGTLQLPLHGGKQNVPGVFAGRSCSLARSQLVRRHLERGAAERQHQAQGQAAKKSLHKESRQV